MANKIYPKGKEHFAHAGVDFGGDVIKALLITSGYTPNFSTDEFVADIGANIVATSGALASKTYALGVLNAAALVFTGVSGATVTQVALFKDTGSTATSPLLVYWDTATGLPLTPNGGDITLAWDTGANKIAVL